MGVFARDDRKNSISKEIMVGIRVSDKTNNHNHNNDSSNSTPTTSLDDLDQEKPNKKMKLLHEIQPLTPNYHQIHKDNQNPEPEFMICDDGNADEVEDEEEDDDDDGSDGEPIGDVFRVSDDGGVKRNHYRAFQFDGNVFSLEDTVLVAPEVGKVKPSVAIIKDIFQVGSGRLMVQGRRFYRPEEAEKKEGGTWFSSDARELFYSSYLDELETCNVMHKCIIHLIPFGKTLPDRKQQPGFVVQKFYDFTEKKIRYLTEKDCEGVFSLPRVAETA